jgi:DmsE family decaheme c-type cytochrome
MLVVLWLSAAAVSAQESKPGTRAAPQYTSGGTESCLRCHGAATITLMGDTAHGNTANPHTPYAQHGCEACHGPGSLHVSRARGGAGFPALLRFGDRQTRSQQTAACLNCHGKDMGELAGMEWTGSLHDTSRMTCVSCHTLHTTENTLADARQQTDNCNKCHAEQIAAHPRFEDKGIVFDRLTCSDCHDVHQLLKAP